MADSPIGAEDLAAIVDEVHRFGANRIDPLSIDEAHKIPKELLDEVAELGLFSLSIPEEFGGMGLPLGPICEVITALARYDRSVATTIGLHLGLGTRGLIRYGQDSHGRTLERLASGEHIAAFAATEAGAGSDLRAVSTKAVPNEGGLLLNGEKIFVTNGGLASTFTLLVSTPGLAGRRKGFSLVCVDREMQGVSVGPEEQKLGLRGSSTTTVVFENVQLTMDDIIGEPGHGMDQAMHVLAWGRTAMAAGCVGAAGEALSKAVHHVHERVQFSKTLVKQPVVQEQIADMAALHFAMQAMVRHTASCDDERALERSSLATKVLCSEGNWEICDRSIQLFGGSGYIEETGMPLLLRDARITRIFEGANDVLIHLIGTLEATMPSPEFEGSGPGAEEASRLCGLVDDFRRHLSSTFKMRLLRRPRLLAQLGRLVVYRQSAICVVQAAERSGTTHDKNLAEHWIKRCFAKVTPLLHMPYGTQGIEQICEHIAEEARL